MSSKRRWLLFGPIPTSDPSSWNTLSESRRCFGPFQQGIYTTVVGPSAVSFGLGLGLGLGIISLVDLIVDCRVHLDLLLLSQILSRAVVKVVIPTERYVLIYSGFVRATFISNFALIGYPSQSSFIARLFFKSVTYLTLVKYQTLSCSFPTAVIT